MEKEQIQLLLQQYKLLQSDKSREQAVLAEAALFLEENFRIVLTDEEICEENLGSPVAMEIFILKRLDKDQLCVESVE